MNKIKLLLFFFVLLTGFVCQQDDIDKLDVKINKISYTPQIFGQVYAKKGEIFERFKLTLTNTGTTDSSVNFKESFISDKDDNRYYFYYGKATLCREGSTTSLRELLRSRGARAGRRSSGQT